MIVLSAICFVVGFPLLVVGGLLSITEAPSKPGFAMVLVGAPLTCLAALGLYSVVIGQWPDTTEQIAALRNLPDDASEGDVLDVLSGVGATSIQIGSVSDRNVVVFKVHSTCTKVGFADDTFNQVVAQTQDRNNHEAPCEIAWP